MPTRDEKLCVGQGTPRGAFIRFLELAPALLDLHCFNGDLLADFRGEFLASQPGKPFRPARGPVADGVGVARLAGLLEVFCQLLVLLEVGIRWKCVRHTKLLSWLCLVSALTQAERRFVKLDCSA